MSTGQPLYLAEGQPEYSPLRPSSFTMIVRHRPRQEVMYKHQRLSPTGRQNMNEFVFQLPGRPQHRVPRVADPPSFSWIRPEYTDIPEEEHTHHPLFSTRPTPRRDEHAPKRGKSAMGRVLIPRRLQKHQSPARGQTASPSLLTKQLLHRPRPIFREPLAAPTRSLTPPKDEELFELNARGVKLPQHRRSTIKGRTPPPPARRAIMEQKDTATATPQRDQLMALTSNSSFSRVPAKMQLSRNSTKRTRQEGSDIQRILNSLSTTRSKEALQNFVNSRPFTGSASLLGAEILLMEASKSTFDQRKSSKLPGRIFRKNEKTQETYKRQGGGYTLQDLKVPRMESPPLSAMLRTQQCFKSAQLERIRKLEVAHRPKAKHVLRSKERPLQADATQFKITSLLSESLGPFRPCTSTQDFFPQKTESPFRFQRKTPLKGEMERRRESSPNTFAFSKHCYYPQSPFLRLTNGAGFKRRGSPLGERIDHVEGVKIAGVIRVPRAEEESKEEANKEGIKQEAREEGGCQKEEERAVDSAESKKLDRGGVLGAQGQGKESSFMRPLFRVSVCGRSQASDS